MLQSEFENLTDIYPDVLLYEAAEHEYNTGDFASKAEFCDCFKADEDGLATKCQRIANERWFKAEEHIEKLTVENNRLEDAIQDLKEENKSLREERETTERAVRLMQEIVQMFRVLEDYVRDDVGVQDIGRAVVAFVDLLDRKAVERNV